MLTVKLRMRIKLTRPRPPQPDIESLSDPRISARLSQECSDIRDGTKRVNEEVTAFIQRMFQEHFSPPAAVMTNKPQAEKTQDPNQAKQGNCTTNSSQMSQKPTDNKSNKPIGTQKSQPKRKRKNRTKTKVKATIQESTPEELDDAETTHFLRTMFDERPATEVSRHSE